MPKDTIVSAIAAIQHAFAVATLIGPMPKISDIPASGATARINATSAISQAQARDLTVHLLSG